MKFEFRKSNDDSRCKYQNWNVQVLRKSYWDVMQIGDWGNLSDDDKQENEIALKQNYKIAWLL